jgi:large subunit ribosomal protein L3
MKAIMGKKLKMTRIFDEKGNVVPVTLIVAGVNIVTQIKTQEKDGYEAVQIAIPDDRKINNPQKGHLKKAGIKSRTLKEFPLTEKNIGDKLDLSQFEVGDIVKVSATSKGKGFSGTIKRHNFSTGPKTHGSNNYRQPGSIGGAYPQRVIKGKKMAGHMGHEKVTIKGLKVINIDSENKVIMISGAVPGHNKSKVLIWSK